MKFIILVITGLILFSCQKEQPLAPYNENYEFPMTIGSQWKYNVTDTTYYTNFDDSIVVNNGILEIIVIKSTSLDNGKKAFLWQYKFKNSILDTLYISSSNDTVFFYNDKNVLSTNKIFIFPLQVNNEWQFDPCNEYRVVRQDTLNLSFGTIKGIYNVEHKFICEGEAGLVDNYYIKSSIGIVKYEFHYMNIHYGMMQNKNWILKSYSIGE
ncbi:MAG: hypothetical protein GXO90_03635 [FCB group bacterium]|nr:hypothetical protein [FCB group bacterium]